MMPYYLLTAAGVERPSVLLLGVVVDRWDGQAKEAEKPELTSAELVEDLVVVTPCVGPIVYRTIPVLFPGE